LLAVTKQLKVSDRASAFARIIASISDFLRMRLILRWRRRLTLSFSLNK
jgi:hypothetical protein